MLALWLKREQETTAVSSVEKEKGRIHWHGNLRLRKGQGRINENGGSKDKPQMGAVVVAV